MNIATITSPLTDSAGGTTHWRLRRWARLRAHRLDRDLDAGTPAFTGTPLAAHAARIVEPIERRRLAAGLRTALDRARGRNAGTSRRIPLQHKAILADSVLISEIVQRLEGAGCVRPRGIARLRLLLGDAAGPLYVTGSGSLAAQLRGVIAAI